MRAPESASEPYDNASCESFIKTLKREEIYAHKYENLAFTNQHRRIHRRVLQSAALAFCASLLLTGGIRAQDRKPGRKSRRDDRGFCEQKERQKDCEGAAGDGDSDAVPFPRPLLLLGDVETAL